MNPQTLQRMPETPEMKQFLQEQARQNDLPLDVIRARFRATYGTLEKGLRAVRAMEAENQAGLTGEAAIQIGVSCCHRCGDQLNPNSM